MVTATMAMTRAEAEEFLFFEAQLLDERRYDDWLDLFDPEGIYWIPMKDGTNPKLEPSVLFDDTALRQQRVHQLLREPHYAQMPPSRTLRTISNVRVETPLRDEYDATVRFNMLVTEVRPGDHAGLQHGLGVQQSFGAACEYRLRRHKKGWRMLLRKIMLLNRDLPIINITFIV